MSNQKVGWIGLGKMGIPMVQNLVNAAYQVVVYNRDQTKAETFISQGLQVANTPSALLTQCEVVILMVADDAAVEAIFSGENGLLSAAVHNKIIVNMSTVSPSISKRMAQLALQKGHAYIDAPVSGSVKQATDGTLVIMAGGNPTVFDSVKPIFDVLGKLALHVGENGAGNAAKLAMNTLLGFHALGLAETILFAKQQGIATTDLMELINNSAMGNVFMKIKGDAVLNDNYQAAFALKHIVKDLRLAQAEGSNTPLAATSLNTYEKASGNLLEEDIIAIIKTL